MKGQRDTHRYLTLEMVFKSKDLVADVSVLVVWFFFFVECRTDSINVPLRLQFFSQTLYNTDVTD